MLLAVVTARLTRPLRLLTRVAGRLRQGDLTARAGPLGSGGGPGDEVGELAAAFDALAGRLQGSSQELTRAGGPSRRRSGGSARRSAAPTISTACSRP